MKGISVQARKSSPLPLGLAGLSWLGLSLLLGACASTDTNQKTAGINSAFPITYNAGDRAFDSHWPYGPAGYH
jgi:hypothetical protein